jgi:hypothetical protein
MDWVQCVVRIVCNIDISCEMTNWLLTCLSIYFDCPNIYMNRGPPAFHMNCLYCMQYKQLITPNPNPKDEINILTLFLIEK